MAGERRLRRAAGCAPLEAFLIPLLPVQPVCLKCAGLQAGLYFLRRLTHAIISS